MNNDKYTIAVIGLGYVGLPLAIELSKAYKVWGYDTDIKRVNEITKGYDATDELKNC